MRICMCISLYICICMLVWVCVHIHTHIYTPPTYIYLWIMFIYIYVYTHAHANRGRESRQVTLVEKQVLQLKIKCFHLLLNFTDIIQSKNINVQRNLFNIIKLNRILTLSWLNVNNRYKGTSKPRGSRSLIVPLLNETAI